MCCMTKELKPGLCNSLDVWDEEGSGRGVQEGEFKKKKEEGYRYT